MATAEEQCRGEEEGEVGSVAVRAGVIWLCRKGEQGLGAWEECAGVVMVWSVKTRGTRLALGGSGSLLERGGNMELDASAYTLLHD